MCLCSISDLESAILILYFRSDHTLFTMSQQLAEIFKEIINDVLQVKLLPALGW